MGIIAQAVLGSLATFAPDQALQPVQPPALVSSDTGLQVDKAALRRNHVHGSAAPEAVTHVPFAFQAALAARLGMVQSPAATPPVTIPEMEKKLAELQAPAGRRNSLTDYFQQFLKTSARLDPQNSLYVDTRNSEREKLEKAVKGVCDTAEAQLLTAQQKYTSSNPRLAEHSRQQADGIVRSLQEQRASIASAFRESRYYQDNLRARNPSGSATASLPAAPNADDINFVVDRSLTVKVRVGATTQLRPGEVLIFKKDPLHPTKYATDELAQFLCDAAVARAAANQPTPKRLQIGNDSSITEQALKGQIAAAEKRVAAYVDAFERFRDDVRDDPALIGRVTDYAERTLQAAAETADLAAAAPHITAAEQQLAGVTRAITDGGNALRMTLQDDIRGQDVAARRIYDDAVDRDNSNAHVAQGLTTSDAYLSTVSEQIDSILSGTDTEAVKSQKLAALASSIIADKDKLLARSQSDLIERERVSNDLADRVASAAQKASEDIAQWKNTLALQEQNADGYNRDLAKLAEDQRLRTIELDAHNRFKVLKAQLGPNDGYGYGAVVGIGLDGKLNVGFAMPTWLADLMGIDRADPAQSNVGAGFAVYDLPPTAKAKIADLKQADQTTVAIASVVYAQAMDRAAAATNPALRIGTLAAMPPQATPAQIEQLDARVRIIGSTSPYGGSMAAILDGMRAYHEVASDLALVKDQIQLRKVAMGEVTTASHAVTVPVNNAFLEAGDILNQWKTDNFAAYRQQQEELNAAAKGNEMASQAAIDAANSMHNWWSLYNDGHGCNVDLFDW